MNILYIGSSGPLSLVPFTKLLATAHNIAAVGLYKPLRLESRIIALENQSLTLAANQQEIPVIDLARETSVTIAQIQEYGIDVIIMSCYSKRLADGIVSAAGHGCFNLHPSLLPGYRGPEPVFWQMKEAAETGVSWHRVVHEFDAGAIVKQLQVKLEDGASHDEISQQLAESGAGLLMELLTEIETDQLTETAQRAELASYYPYPGQQDFTVDTSWSARHAFNFIRATGAFGHTYPCRAGNTVYLLDTALAYDNATSLDATQVQGTKLLIPFNDGVLIAQYTDRMDI